MFSELDLMTAHHNFDLNKLWTNWSAADCDFYSAAGMCLRGLGNTFGTGALKTRRLHPRASEV